MIVLNKLMVPLWQRIFRWIFLASCVALVLYVWHERSWRTTLDKVINRGMLFYTEATVPALRDDDYFLYESVLAQNGKKSPWPQHERFMLDPFKRLLNRSQPIEPLTFYRRARPLEKLEVIDRNSYVLDQPYQRFMRDPTDDILTKALYCDQSGYDERDWAILNTIENGKGDYWDTHFLMSLVLLQTNHCFDANKITMAIDRVVQSIVLSAQRDQGPVGDLFAERVVVLYWAGEGDLVEQTWIERIRDAGDPAGGWRDSDIMGVNGHTTGLALLALLFAYEGSEKQPIYVSDI